MMLKLGYLSERAAYTTITQADWVSLVIAVLQDCFGERVHINYQDAIR